jgi:hypothetical protein
MTSSRRKWVLASLAALLGPGTIEPARAQYTAVPPPPLEDEVRYFGAAKDEAGKLLDAVTFTIGTGALNFVYVTDHDGRFRGAMPKEIPYDAVQAQCMKPGYETVRVSKRLGPTPKRPVVQVDCRLRRVTP